MECSGKGLILLEATLWELQQELDCALLSFFFFLTGIWQFWSLSQSLAGLE